MEENDAIEELLRTERIANVLSQESSIVRREIEGLVIGEQVPGCLGDLIKRSVEMTAAHKEFEGTNVVSIFGKRV